MGVSGTSFHCNDFVEVKMKFETMRRWFPFCVADLHMNMLLGKLILAYLCVIVSEGWNIIYYRLIQTFAYNGILEPASIYLVFNLEEANPMEIA
mmetsp:Transcript_11824/g.15400  ORF Transcript_11824/g.15400 Transcript_11824/m.15400 type:complete len:94 (-) Transcript_11824:1482-1763(-)